MERRLIAAFFWVTLLGFIALDYARAPRDRFSEPPAIALGNERTAGGGHCSGAPR
jgi:hypothetical protein